MGKHVIQIPSADGCICVYDADRKTLRKICGTERMEDIPEDAQETLDAVNLRVAAGTA
jgi:hypothetical protein